MNRLNTPFMIKQCIASSEQCKGGFKTSPAKVWMFLMNVATDILLNLFPPPHWSNFVRSFVQIENYISPPPTHPHRTRPAASRYTNVYFLFYKYKSSLDEIVHTRIIESGVVLKTCCQLSSKIVVVLLAKFFASLFWLGVVAASRSVIGGRRKPLTRQNGYWMIF